MSTALPPGAPVMSNVMSNNEQKAGPATQWKALSREPAGGQLAGIFAFNTWSRASIPASSGSEECFGRTPGDLPHEIGFKILGILKVAIFDPPRSRAGRPMENLEPGAGRGPTGRDIHTQYGVPGSDSCFVGLGGVFRAEPRGSRAWDPL